MDVELGYNDMTTEESLLALQMAMPQEGHLFLVPWSRTDSRLWHVLIGEMVAVEAQLQLTFRDGQGVLQHGGEVQWAWRRLQRHAIRLVDGSLAYIEAGQQKPLPRVHRPRCPWNRP